MHELSIATGVIDTVEEYAAKEKAVSVSYIELDIGELSGVVIEALDFAMTEAVKNTICSKAEVKINNIKAKAKCKKCDNVFNISDIYCVCEKCNNFDNEIIQGKELNLKKILVKS